MRRHCNEGVGVCTVALSANGTVMLSSSGASVVLVSTISSLKGKKSRSLSAGKDNV